SCFVRQSDLHGSRADAARTGADVLEVRTLVRVEVDEDRVEGNDGRQERWGRWSTLDKVARGDLSSTDATRDGCANGRPIQVELRVPKRCLGAANRGRRVGNATRARVELFSRDGLCVH